ncbi:UNVERIFIED_CONTAM: Proline-rich receptor-like protein kinase PERK1 [Sesamum angustifolium]|uniref:non-specific serine/threonine protein kinase n=1 Tax=Sesamum angustifolium TaxID=2727405 RepID=A0AAW2LKQ3_9LAMI
MSSPPPGAAPGPISPPAPPGPPSPAVLLFRLFQTMNSAGVAIPPPGSSNRTTLLALGVGIGIGGAIVLVCVGIFVIWYKRRKRKLLGMAGFAYAPPQPQGPKGKGRPPINWATRMKIALGSARGLAYLHEDCHPKIIHRDIKSANILLDDNFEAKVADFWASDTDTHVSTRVMGTFGYLAPEYALTGKLTDKSDVFSFGVVLLELITGRRPIDKSQNYLDDNIVDWARPLLAQALESGNFDSVADPRLQKEYDSIEMAWMCVCVRHWLDAGPDESGTSNYIIHALEGNLSLDELSEGVQPGHSAVYDSHGSSDYDASYDTTQYKEDLIKFRKMALESVEITSECSGPTSEFGHQPSGSSSEGLRNTQEIQQ